MIAKLIEKNCRNIFAHPFLYLAILLSITGFLGYFYVTLPTDTSVESLIIENDPDLVFYEKFKKQFGEDEFLVVGFSAPDVFAEDILQFIKEQTVKIEALDEVKEVVSLTNVEDFIGSENDFIIKPLIEAIPTSKAAKELIRGKALDNRLIKGNLISDDSTAALFFIRPKSSLTSDRTFDARLVKNVEQVFTEKSPEFADIDCHIAGWLVTDVNLSTYMEKDMLCFMPLTYLLLVILIGLALKNCWSVFLSILNVSICLIWTLATLNLIGGAMSPITSILPPLIMALVVSDSIHIFVEFLKHDRTSGNLPEVILQTLKTLAVPCFLTSITTAIGFASLGISDIPPIRHFGFAASLGMICEFLLSMTIIPLGIYFLRNKTSLHKPSILSKSSLHSFLNKFSIWVQTYRLIFAFSALAIIVISLFGISKLTVETNLLEYFKKKSPVYQDSQFIDDRLGGVSTLEISFQAKNPDAILEPDNLNKIERVANFLEQQAIVSKTTSINDFLKEMNKAFHNDDRSSYMLPESKALAAQYLLLYDGDDIENFIDENRQWTTLSARITAHNSKIIDRHIKKLREFLGSEIKSSDLDIKITGKTLLANRLVKGIVDSQVQSLAVAFMLIFALLFFIFRSVFLGFISIIPNALPILFNLGLMGFAGIPLNSATAIISAVALGIAVDDTIHFIHQYQREKSLNLSVKEAIHQTIIIKGAPIITTSLILMGGFGILLFGSFVPTIQFGFLSALIMLFALLCDLIILPVSLLAFAKK